MKADATINEKTFKFTCKTKTKTNKKTDQSSTVCQALKKARQILSQNHKNIA